MIETIVLLIKTILVFLFLWVTSFLWHELMHLKHRGLGGKGIIDVDVFSMSALIDYKATSLFYLAGGLYTGIIFILAGFLVSDLVWMWCLFTVGVVNLVYGFFEMHFLPKWGNSSRYQWNRYLLYCMVTIICIIIGWKVTR